MGMPGSHSPQTDAATAAPPARRRGPRSRRSRRPATTGPDAPAPGGRRPPHGPTRRLREAFDAWDAAIFVVEAGRLSYVNSRLLETLDAEHWESLEGGDGQDRPLLPTRDEEGRLLLAAAVRQLTGERRPHDFYTVEARFGEERCRVEVELVPIAWSSGPAVAGFLEIQGVVDP